MYEIPGRAIFTQNPLSRARYTNILTSLFIPSFQQSSLNCANTLFKLPTTNTPILTTLAYPIMILSLHKLGLVFIIPRTRQIQSSYQTVVRLEWISRVFLIFCQDLLLKCLVSREAPKQTFPAFWGVEDDVGRP